MLATIATQKAPKAPLLTLEDRLLMQAVENMKRFVPGGSQLFNDLCDDTAFTLELLQTRPAQTPVELAVKQEYRRLKMERMRAA